MCGQGDIPGRPDAGKAPFRGACHTLQATGQTTSVFHFEGSGSAPGSLR
jgi:hypothetical protein